MFQTSYIINLSIRALTLLGKFVLFFYMAKYLEPSDLGIYGLFVTLTIFAVYVVGLDFYTFSTRELAVIEKKNWADYIKSQLFLLFLTYLTFFPIFLYISTFFISTQWIYFLVFIVFLEHINQEIMRLLIVDNKTILANNLLFIRSGLWCYFIIGLMFFSVVEHKLNNILITWLSFGIIVLIFGTIYALQGVDLRNARVQYDWLKKGLKISIFFLFSTIIVRLMMTIDKLWLEFLEGIEKVAVYSLFFSLSSVLIAFLDSGYFSFLYPKMIKHKENKQLFLKLVKDMTKGTIIIVFVISVIMIIFFPYFLKWVDRGIYIEYKNIFYILLFSNIVYSFSMIPHYILYAKNRDSKIMWSHLLGIIVFVVGTLILLYYNVSMPIAYGLLLAFLTIFFVKSYFSIKLI